MVTKMNVWRGSFRVPKEFAPSRPTPPARWTLASVATALLVAVTGQWRTRIRARRERDQLLARIRDLEALNQHQSDLLQTVTHELRTPVTVIDGYVEMFVDGSLGAAPAGWAVPLSALHGKVREVNRLVQMLLESARADTRPTEAEIEEVDATEVAASAVSAQRLQASQTGHQLRLHAPEGPVPVLCDPTKLTVVMRNLIENAVKYSPAHSIVDVAVAPAGESVELFVSDRGPGVPRADRSRIFEQFHRLRQPETRGVGGTGLGLFIVRQMLSAQGGSICVEDRDGGGSTFTVTVPRRLEAAPPPS